MGIAAKRRATIGLVGTMCFMAVPQNSLLGICQMVLVLFSCSAQEARSAWSTCSHNLALIQISGRAAISWMSSSTSGKDRIPAWQAWARTPSVPRTRRFRRRASARASSNSTARREAFVPAPAPDLARVEDHRRLVSRESGSGHFDDGPALCLPEQADRACIGHAERQSLGDGFVKHNAGFEPARGAASNSSRFSLPSAINGPALQSTVTMLLHPVPRQCLGREGRLHPTRIREARKIGLRHAGLLGGGAERQAAAWRSSTRSTLTSRSPHARRSARKSCVADPNSWASGAGRDSVRVLPVIVHLPLQSAVCHVAAGKHHTADPVSSQHKF